MIKFVILEADTPSPEVMEKYGSYGDIFLKLLEGDGLDLTKGDAVIEKYHIVEASEKLPSLNPDSPQKPDVVLITGSQHNAYDDEPWILDLVEFVQKCFGVHPTADLQLERPVKVMGICFGHQIISRALGAKIGPNPKGWEVSITPIDLTHTGHEVFYEFKDVGTVNIMEMHKDIVFDVPKGLPGIEVTSSNEKCSIQGLYKRQYLWSTQGHPEYNDDMVEKLLYSRHKEGVFTDEMLEDGLSRLHIKNDSNDLCKSMVRFIYD